MCTKRTVLFSFELSLEWAAVLPVHRTLALFPTVHLQSKGIWAWSTVVQEDQATSKTVIHYICTVQELLTNRKSIREEGQTHNCQTRRRNKTKKKCRTRPIQTKRKIYDESHTQMQWRAERGKTQNR